MKHIVIDLEMNSLAKAYKQEKILCGMEVIEIGAVVLDEQYQEIGSFKTLVKPQYNDEIKPYYEKLTGISTAMVANAPVFETALKMFCSWCHSMNDELQFYQWSETDLEQITNEMILKEILLDTSDQQLFTKWEDFQKEYGETLNLSNAISLKNAVMYAGVDFEGAEHDALDDARNTAILLKIVRTPALCKQALEHVIDALTPKPVSSTLGSMFNFAELGFAV
jgi:inhibitor of KinA sporulation pathway (predicted exonuclease)